MSRALGSFLKLYQPAGPVRERWQSYWNDVVTHESASWRYVPFVADGFIEGDSGTEQSISVRLPASSADATAAQLAIAAGWLVELRIYQFDSVAAAAGPSGMTLVGQFNGQVVGGEATATSITLQLGSALAPVGATVPPRTLTSAIMGVGAQL